MNFIQFKSGLSKFPVFSTSDIRAMDPVFDRRRLTEWQNKGYIIKIIKGCYLFSDIEVDESRLFQIANKIYKPSYVSFETALAYYQLIPESVYQITSAATKRTYKFETTLAYYSFRTISKRLFFGYLLESNNVKVASMEKAILDYFYVNTSVKTVDDFASLRIDKDAFWDQLDQEKLMNYLERFNQKTLAARIRQFTEWIKNA